MNPAACRAPVCWQELDPPLVPAADADSLVTLRAAVKECLNYLQYCMSRAGPANTGQYASTLACIFLSCSFYINKSGGKRSFSNRFFFLLHFTPTFSAPCNLIFYTSFICFYSAHLCVFFFFFTPWDQLSPRVWHL